jgi:hypothetical protein
MWILLASAACMLLGAIVLFATVSGPADPNANRNHVASAAANSSDAPDPLVAVGASASATGREQIVDDSSGKLLWASPTNGVPLSLAYVPGGTQCLIHFRPALVASHPEGERILAALGPWGKSIVTRLEASLNSKLADIDSLLVAIIVTPDGRLDACLRATLNASALEKPLADRLPPGESKEHGDHAYRVLEGRAHFIPPPGQDTIVVCPTELAAELLDSEGQAPPLVRDVENLAAHAHGDRAVIVIVAPKFLEASGNELLTYEATPLHEVLHALVAADTTAIALSAHWDDNFFTELRATPTLNLSPRRLAVKLHERIAAAPNAIEETVLASPWHPHARKILARFPAMLRALARYSRPGEDDGQAVVRAYLPPMAGHNLLMAAELLLTQPRAGESVTATEPSTVAKPSNVEERLAATTSLSFSKDSLERALELLAEDIGVEIVLQGADLQLDGITKNQSLALDLQDRPAGEILLEILLRANPDRTATGPGDPRQKLVYVIQPGQAGGPERIIVTTRTAAEKRKWPLPGVFLPTQR